MTESKKKRKGWSWLLGAAGLGVVLFLGLQYSKLGGFFHTDQAAVSSQTFIQDKITQGTQFMKTTINAQEQTFLPGGLESIISPWSAKLGISADQFVLFSILLASITLAALLIGWYLRKFSKKKWLGYLISFIGFLPILPIMIAGTLVYWMGKGYWKNGKVHSSKKSAKKNPINSQGSNPMNQIDEWEQAM